MTQKHKKIRKSQLFFSHPTNKSTGASPKTTCLPGDSIAKSAPPRARADTAERTGMMAASAWASIGIGSLLEKFLES